ncbi:hypothetical protein SLH46_06610 [Draconibacterium sp. IB214405]|uniref:hypothetical protein n=1 Tax=Draconibacterium sp. IB214405 TaxID=3097352 RepID=UPI002A18389A|nr:hypothetical protein [Draconibacterium sp. IB214405]MDX8338845.1 hypothetical protein [Draconibacterium sp. IB214405]
MKKKVISFGGLGALVVVLGLLFINAGSKNESKAIIKLLENERKTFCDNDFEAYAKNWVKDEQALFMYAGMDSHFAMQGWDLIRKSMAEHMDWKIENDIRTVENPEDFEYHNILVDGDMAWANISQYDDDKNVKDRRAYVLKKVNNDWKILNINLLGVDTYAEGKFVVDANKAPEKTHVNLNDFPKDKVFPMIEGWGGMCVDINNAPAGTDFTPLLEGLENDHCQVPHWGYVVKGAIRMDYEDGSSEIFSAGEAFYMKPGHTGGVLEDLLLVSFGPEEGIQHLVDHFEKKVAAMQAQ